MSVIDNAFETRGTQLYFVKADGITVGRVTCPTGITGIGGGTKDKIDTTCLDNTSSRRTFIGGFADASEVTVPFIFYDGDSGHLDLMTLQESGANTGWYVGLSDGTAAPTISTSGLDSPAARSGWEFSGYVANLTFDAAINDVVKGSLTIQPSGGAHFHPST